MSLSSHPFNDIVPQGSEPFASGPEPLPGDQVQHINDHESVGIVVANVDDRVAVIWAKEPRLRASDVSTRLVYHSIQQTTDKFIGNANDERSRSALISCIRSRLEGLRRSDHVTDYEIEPIRFNEDRPGSFSVVVKFMPLWHVNYVSLQVTVGP